MARTTRGRPRRLLVGTVAVLVAAPALVACAPAPAPSTPTAGTTVPTPDPSPAPTLPAAEFPDLTVEVRQSRGSWADRVVQLRVGSSGSTADDVVLRAVRLTAPSVVGVAASDPQWERRLPAGRAREAPVALGEPRCPPPDGTPVVEVDVRDGAGREGTVRTVPTDPRGHLRRIAGEDCAALAVAAGLRIGFLPDLEVTGTGRDTRATLRLELDPVPGGPAVTVHQVDGSVLISPTAGPAWTLPDGTVTQRTVVDLELRPARCDAHAVAEDKRGSHFAVHATVDGVAVPTFYVGTGEDLRGELHDLVGRYCGW